MPKSDELAFDYDIKLPMPATHMYSHHAAFRLEVDLTGDFDIDIAVTWDRVNQPVEYSTGGLPQKVDFCMTVGLGYEF